MKTTVFPLGAAFAAVLFFLRTPARADGVDLNLTPVSGAIGAGEALDYIDVELKGKINHFGSSFHAVVPGVRVWLAEWPETKVRNIVSDEKGWWRLTVRKRRGETLWASVLYTKDGWPTTKSNAIAVGDENDGDLAVQFVDPKIFYAKLKPYTEFVASAMPGGGPGFKMRNALVATVGKSWASMHDDRLPHGDPGAKAPRIPSAIGPIYFDEEVKPNAAYKKTSVDGGVAWVNVPPGVHEVTARKDGVTYRPIRFVVADSDAEEGVELYVASPPDSIQGSNDSPPGSD